MTSASLLLPGLFHAGGGNRLGRATTETPHHDAEVVLA
jgi:hypothetical protein